jgi:hypothetical protein
MESTGAAMTDYQIQASTRRCAATGREINPGERYYSVLLDEGDHFTRHDYSPEGWQGPPDNTFSFWQSRMPASGAPRRPPIDEELLLDCLARLEGESEPGKQAFRFVLALLLVRRKRLRIEDAGRDGEQEVLTLRDRAGVRYRVIDPGLPDEELECVQDEVFRVLGWS